MKFRINAKRWVTPIDSGNEESEPINEIRLIQVPNTGYVKLYINGKFAMNVELNKDGGGEYIQIVGNHEEFND